MIVTSKIRMDLQQPGMPQTIHAVQDDRYSRNLEISLYSGSVAWNLPVGTSVLIRYCKPDQTGGRYDRLPDGSTAWNAAGNVLTIALAPQVLTVPGVVTLDVMIYAGEQSISTFQVLLQVARAVGAALADSENYFNMSAEIITNALGYTPVDPNRISMGIHTDGLLYLFVDGAPVGTGVQFGGIGNSYLDHTALGYAVLASRRDAT